MALETKELTDLYYEFINLSKKETPFSKFMNFLGFLLATSFVIFVVLFGYSLGVEELNEKYERWGETIWLDYFLAIGSYAIGPILVICFWFGYITTDIPFVLFQKETKTEKRLKQILNMIYAIEERDHKKKQDSEKNIPAEIKNDYNSELQKRWTMYTDHRFRINELERKYKFNK